MDLDQMKNTWSELSDGLSKSTKLQDEEILKMIHRKSTSRLNRIVYLEVFGSIVTVAAITYLAFNFYKLDNWLAIIGGVATILVFLVALLLSANIIRKARRVDLLKSSYQQTIDNFNELRKTLKLYKTISIYLNVFLPFLFIPVMASMFLGKNLLEDLEVFGKMLLASFLLIPPVFYLLIRFYKKNVREAKQALDSLEEK